MMGKSRKVVEYAGFWVNSVFFGHKCDFWSNMCHFGSAKTSF